MLYYIQYYAPLSQVIVEIQDLNIYIKIYIAHAHPYYCGIVVFTLQYSVNCYCIYEAKNDGKMKIEWI